MGVLGLMLGEMPALGAGEKKGGWLQRAAERLAAELKAPAVWLAGGTSEAIATAAVGLRKHGEAEAASTADKLMIASVSKPFAGTWVAWMVQQGKISYETKLLDVMPELRSVCRPERTGITLAQLLTHTSGVKRDAYPQAEWGRAEQLPAYRQAVAGELVRSAEGGKREGNAPYSYSNAGLSTAVTLVERAAKVNYNVHAADYFSKRCGLPSWGMGSPNPNSDLTAPWHHYLRETGRIEPRPSFDEQRLVAYPSGGAHCTIGDLARFGQIYLKALREPTSPLGIARLPELMARRSDSFNTLCAWGREEHLQLPVFTHGGGLLGLRSGLEIIPDLDLVFAYVVTSGWWNQGKLVEPPTDINMRVRNLVRDEMRRQRARKNKPIGCQIAMTRVTTVDASRKQEVRPTKRDDRIRVNVEFTVSGARTIDLKVAASLADQKQEVNAFKGLDIGNHLLYFDFNVPKSATCSIEVLLDALGTNQSKSSKEGMFKSKLRLQ